MYKYVNSKSLVELEYCLGVLGMCHFDEVEREHSKTPYKPDVKAFLKLMEGGFVQLTLAKEGEKIIGYICNLVSPCLLTQENVGKEIGMYVMPHYRGDSHFTNMVRVTKKHLKEMGVMNYYISFKEGHNHKAPMGFNKAETTYVSKLR